MIKDTPNEQIRPAPQPAHEEDPEAQHQSANMPPIPQAIGKLKIEQKLGCGSFGEIYRAVNTQTGEEFAVKLERAMTKTPQLFYENRLYKMLQDGGVGIPLSRWYGVEGPWNVLVMDLLGESLESLFTRCRRIFSLKTVLMIADQLITRIEFLHNKNFLHRDIKPDNFLVSRNPRDPMIYMIDFGLAKRYRDHRTHQHIPYREDKGLTGTVRYATVNTHLGIEQSRRDDLESLGYIFVYFLKGSLPWQGQKAQTRQHKYQKIGKIKMTQPIDFLCSGLPPEFATYLTYTRQLRFEAKPDYAYLRRLFHDVFVREGFAWDHRYDWTPHVEATWAQQHPGVAAPAPPPDSQLLLAQGAAFTAERIGTSGAAPMHTPATPAGLTPHAMVATPSSSTHMAVAPACPATPASTPGPPGGSGVGALSAAQTPPPSNNGAATPIPFRRSTFIIPPPPPPYSQRHQLLAYQQQQLHLKQMQLHQMQAHQSQPTASLGISSTASGTVPAGIHVLPGSMVSAGQQAPPQPQQHTAEAVGLPSAHRSAVLGAKAPSPSPVGGIMPRMAPMPSAHPYTAAPVMGTGLHPRGGLNRPLS
eukprot:GAFH01000921.1.p1 GENE.GAFH01000921.1~~GAFH01000921.1.p1  ORF type:complete len:586 (+),score=134.65 GAFH01000921.1:92-1849(+)